jgi:hypothetical protein
MAWILRADAPPEGFYTQSDKFVLSSQPFISSWEQGGSHYSYSHTNEGKQIHSSAGSSNQEELATFQGRINAIANQLNPADATFIRGVFSCMGSKGGDVVRYLMGEVAAAKVNRQKRQRHGKLNSRRRSKTISFILRIALSQVITSLCMLSRANLICGYDLRSYTQEAGHLSVVDTGYLQKGHST